MRARIALLRLAVAVALCYLSFSLFVQTPAYLALQELVERLLPGIELSTVMLALLSALVIPACFLGGRRSMYLIYAISIALYLPSALSASSINWASLLGLSVEVRPPALTAPVGLAIMGGYLWLLSTSRIEGEYAELLRRGGAEAGAAASGQLALAATLTLASLLAASSALALAALPLPGALLSRLPSPHLLLGACGVILILACVSLYLLAVKGHREPPGEAPVERSRE